MYYFFWGYGCDHKQRKTLNKEPKIGISLCVCVFARARVYVLVHT